MYDLDLQEREAIEAATLYGTEDSPTGFPYTGGWIQHTDVKAEYNDWSDEKDAYTQNNLISTEEEHLHEFYYQIRKSFSSLQNRSHITLYVPLFSAAHTQADLLIIEEKEIQLLIYSIRMSVHISNSEKIANRLQTLLNDAKEEDSVTPGITVKSLRNFFILLTLKNNLKYPAISLTPDNDIHISWRYDQNQVFSIHFLPNEDVRFVIFKPNEQHPDRTKRLSGTTTTDNLIETVDSHGVWDWVSE